MHIRTVSVMPVFRTSFLPNGYGLFYSDGVFGLVLLFCTMVSLLPSRLSLPTMKTKIIMVKEACTNFKFDYSAIFISVSAEIVGLIFVLFTVGRWGRVVTQTSTYLLGGVSCLLLGFCAYHPKSSHTLLVVLAFLSRMAMMGASCTASKRDVIKS
jgi:hypothetical protein